MNTCGNCKNLNIEMLIPGNTRMGCAASCKETGFVVPHKFDGEAGTITLWRVPESCPDPEMLKSDTRAKEKDWVVIDLKKLS